MEAGGVHVGFKRQIAGHRELQQKDGTWWCMAAEEVLKKAGIQYLVSFIYRRKASVVEWVAMRPILEVYHKEMVYKGLESRREL